MNPLLIAGIGTDVGKTLVSAILIEMLCASYFKPLSTGEPDKDKIEALLQLDSKRTYSEFYRFSLPVSPHYAAQKEQVKIVQKPFLKRRDSSPLIVESAGGVLVPINERETTLDWFKDWPLDWILVSRHYLGSINHTLASYEALKKEGILPKGIIFNGKKLLEHEAFILNYTKLPILGRIYPEKEINLNVIKRYANLWKQNHFWKNYL